MLKAPASDVSPGSTTVCVNGHDFHGAKRDNYKITAWERKTTSHSALFPTQSQFSYEITFTVRDRCSSPIHHLSIPIPFPIFVCYDGEKVIELDPDQSQFTKRFTEWAVDFIERNATRPFLSEWKQRWEFQSYLNRASGEKKKREN